MSESALTPHTASRNLEGLLTETPFKLRLLAQALNGLTTDEQKMAWHQLQTPEARAQYILSLLQGWDSANPGAARPTTNGATPHVGAAPAPQYATPAGAQPQYPPPPQQQQQQQQYAPPPGQMPQQQFQAPVQTQFQMPVQNMPPVGPAQVAPGAAAAATAATAAPTGRKPRNAAPAAAGAPADTEVATQVLSMLQTILAGLGSDAERFQKLQANITGILEEAVTNKTGRLTTLESKYGEVAASLQHLSGAMQSQANVQLWTLMAFLTFMQDSMGVGMVDILRAAISDSAMFQKLVDQALGKA